MADKYVVRRYAHLCATSDNFLSKFVNLTELKLDSATITNQSISLLTNLKKLSITYLASISDESLSCLTGLTELHVISLGAKCSSISTLTNLTMLSAGPCVSDEILLPLTNLTSLDLQSSPVSDNAITKLLLLKDLSVTMTQTVTDSSISLLTYLTKLSVSETPAITDSSIGLLTNLIELKSNEEFTNHGLSTLTNLTSLDICLSPEIKDEHMYSQTRLMSLSVDDTLSDDSISYVVASFTDTDTKQASYKPYVSERVFYGYYRTRNIEFDESSTLQRIFRSFRSNRIAYDKPDVVMRIIFIGNDGREFISAHEPHLPRSKKSSNHGPIFEMPYEPHGTYII